MIETEREREKKILFFLQKLFFWSPRLQVFKVEKLFFIFVVVVAAQR